MNTLAIRPLVALFVATAFTAIGCASPTDDDDDTEGTESAEEAQSGTTRPNACPDGHVCVYENRDFNKGTPNAWAWQFGPEQLYPGAAGQKFQVWFKKGASGGKDKVSSIVNNSKITVCLVNESAGGWRSTNILKVKAGQRFAYVSDVANDKADRIEKC